MNSIASIGSKKIGDGNPCYIIAEVGLAHEGSLGMAISYAKAAYEAGADAIKFQTHLAECEGTKEEKFRVKTFPQDDTRQDYWKRTAFTPDEWKKLKAECDKIGIEFLSSPFSEEAVDLLEEIGTKAYKVGSGETNNIPLLKKLSKTGKPVLLSTGMSFIKEVDEAVELLREENSEIVLFQCTNKYPCPPESIGLNVINEYKERFKLPVGLSDHSGMIATNIAAVSLGAQAIEIHIVWSKDCFGPDTKASVTLDQLKEMVAGIRHVERILSTPLNKDKMAVEMEDLRLLFNKSVVVSQALKKGHKITAADLSYKKPGNGIPAADYTKLIGKIVNKDLSKDTLLSWEDIEK